MTIKSRLLPLLGSSPLLFLLLQIPVSVVVLEARGRFDPQLARSTKIYQRVSQADTVEKALRQTRTYGYPLFLKVMRFLVKPPHVRLVPEVHAALFFGAVMLFWFAVRAWTGSGWLALAAATPLISAPVLSVVDRVQPDFPASALALVSLSVLLLLVRSPGRVSLWILLTALVFLTYQVRPAYVFLIPLVPALGWVLRCCREGRPRLAHARWAAGLALATLVPFLLFCGLRKAVVGHFGLVSFSGFSLIGVTANFIDDELIETLAPESRELAKRIHGRRSGWGWEPMTADSDTRIHHEQWNTNTWTVSINPARRLEARAAIAAQERGERRRFRDVEVNDRLMRLSREVILERPRLYFKWVRDISLLGAARMVRFDWVFWPLAGLVLSLPVAWRRRRIANLADLRLLGLVLLCGAYTAAHLLLVAAVSTVHDRYLVAIGLLLPTALCVLLFALWRPVRPAIQ